jgi:hypothetical protein
MIFLSGDGQVKREICGCSSAQANQHAADNGGAAAAGARNHRQALDQADLDRINGAHFSSTLSTRTLAHGAFLTTK